MTTTTMTNPISSLVLALVASATMLGFAAAPAEAASAQVEVSKYELGTPAGRKAAEARVAAGTVSRYLRVRVRIIRTWSYPVQRARRVRAAAVCTWCCLRLTRRPASAAC